MNMKVVNEVRKMNLGELRALRMVIDGYIEDKANEAVSELQIGDTVKINHAKVRGMKFVITKINRKKFKVKSTTNNVTYSVSKTLIEKI